MAEMTTQENILGITMNCTLCALVSTDLAWDALLQKIDGLAKRTILYRTIVGYTEM